MTEPQHTRKRHRSASFWILALIGSLGLIMVGALVFIDATNKGHELKLAIAKALRLPQPEAVEKVVVKEVEIPVEVEKIVEVPVEKIVEVEKVVELQMPMASEYIPWQRIDRAKMWNGIRVETELEETVGEYATVERERDEAYRLEVKLHLRVPTPNKSVEDLAETNPHLPKMLPDLSQLVENAKVSPFYHHLYELKRNRIQQKATRFEELLSRHNFYDLETILEAQHPETAQRVLIAQGEMDVVSDGSDGDRWPELDDYITMSQHYQPMTSYGWGKRSKTPNPLLSRWQEKLATYKKEFAIKGLSVERNRYLRSQISYLEDGISDMKARSYLIAEADPFFVIPLSLLRRHNDTPFGPQIGDYGVIIYGDKAYPAIAGDAGPSWKFGEASLRVAKTVNEKASAYNRAVSDLTVTYLIFPQSREERTSPPDLVKWKARCNELMSNIGGLGDGYELYEWEDLIAQKNAESQAASPKEGASADQPALPVSERQTD